MNGSNFSTEHGLNLGRIVWNKLDILNIIAINKKFENISLKTTQRLIHYLGQNIDFLTEKAE